MTERSMIPGAVGELLDGTRRRWRRIASLHDATRLGVTLAVIWSVAWLVVATAASSGPALLGTVAAAATATLLSVAALMKRRAPAPGDRLLARFIEERHTALDDRLVTAVDLDRRADHPAPLRAALYADADRAVSGLLPEHVIPDAVARRAAWNAAAAALLCAFVLAAWVVPGRRAADLISAYLWPDHIMLTVSPGNARVHPGQPFEIRVHTSLSGAVPALSVDVQGRSKTIDMPAAADGGFTYRFEKVPASFTYRVAVATRRSPAYSVTLLEPPQLGRIDLHYEYPAYTRLPPRDEEDGGDIYAPEGTRVRLTVHASAGTGTAALGIGGSTMPLSAAGDGRFQGTLDIARDGSYRVALVSREGVKADGAEYFIRVLDDRPPEVRILKPVGDREVTPLEEVDVEARADDDYGVTSLDLVYAVNGGPERVAALPGAREPLSAIGSHTLYLEDLQVKPGDFVTYYARARDTGRGRRPAEARSDIFFLEVKPFEQEFAAAQTQAGSNAAGQRGLEDLVAAQKDVIVATWKLERRSAAGRSTADVKAVARAQGELKARVERAGAPVRRRMRGASPTPRAVEEPMAAAAAAMGRAESSLDALKTREAIPSEMEALNMLLRAQAEQRRTEVLRQQASGMGGAGQNRAQQDLSTLFDRELKRQQQTNYETPRNASEEPDAQHDSLDKVRELAQRQEQLARQQEDLARLRDRLSAEEVKRRLERLTRDQTELRRQAEQLAQQMGQRAEAQRRQGTRGQNAQGSAAGDPSQLRQASEEMQGAASDLRRQDPGQASARGARALDRLRELERQMQGAQPGDDRRAAGDLQLEARSLADRQRQIASELGAGNQDARARAAADQNELAGRTDDLARRATDAARGAGKNRQALDGAARDLTNQQLGKRMRDLARGLRDEAGTSGAGSAEKQADAARELARALDKTADRIGAAMGGNADGQRLSDQLARARETRERLDDLQRRIESLRREGQQGQSAAGSTGQGRQQPSGARAGSAQGTPGQSAQATPGRSTQAELERLQRQYNEQLREAMRLQDELGANRGTTRGGSGAGSTPEGQMMVLSAPGTEAFKQDFSKWDVLHKDVTLNLERLEAGLSQKLLARALQDRVASGAADDAPDAYQQAVTDYFRSLTAKP